MAKQVWSLNTGGRWIEDQYIGLSFGTLSSGRSRQVAVGLKWSLAQVALYVNTVTHDIPVALKLVRF